MLPELPAWRKAFVLGDAEDMKTEKEENCTHLQSCEYCSWKADKKGRNHENEYFNKGLAQVNGWLSQKEHFIVARFPVLIGGFRIRDEMRTVIKDIKKNVTLMRRGRKS